MMNTQRLEARGGNEMASITRLLDARSNLDFIRSQISKLARTQLESGNLSQDEEEYLSALFVAEENASMELTKQLRLHELSH